jgi:P-type Mg2+ transporter
MVPRRQPMPSHCAGREGFPGMRYLLMATLLTMAATLLIPFTALWESFGFRPLPWSFLLVMGVSVVWYMIAAELAKRAFYRRSQG